MKHLALVAAVVAAITMAAGHPRAGRCAHAPLAEKFRSVSEIGNTFPAVITKGRRP